MPHPSLEPLLSPEGWAHASTPPVEANDPGRFHALFGRDSLITALQVLPHRPEVAVATLRALAALQGRREDPEIEEQPGRILHEDHPVAPDWLVELGWPVRDGALRYFGTSDATSWFLLLLDATGDRALAEELAGPRAAAAAWLARALEAGNGLVRCGPRRYPGGLSQQGWRDALDPATDTHGGGIVREDGTAPQAPMADADSQAAAVAALDALVRLDPDEADAWASRATRLRARIESAFGPEVMALEADDRAVSGAGSQLGWLLWADALSPDPAVRVADRLISPDVLTAYGVRTLASSHPAFLTEGYHRGAVWPFDNWLCWGGLRRVGYDDAAERVREGVRRAVRTLGRYPELYAVTPDGEVRDIPIANRVQAWTVGAMIAFDDGWDGWGVSLDPRPS
jgi:glycogen debranching enzyme